MTPGIEAGRVVALWRYPVKSMLGEPLQAVDVSWNGLAGDRRWAFVQNDKVLSGFPWLTIRERPDMWRFRPWFSDPDRPDTSPTMVRTPHGRDLETVDPELAAALGGGVRAIKHDLGVFDTMPLALMTVQTVAALGYLVGRELDIQRFRPNLIIDASGGAPYSEDSWVGRVLHVGGMTMRVDKRDKRCVMVNVDPLTIERDPAILRTIAQEREACLGVYGSTVQPGRVALGDPVIVKE